MADNINVKEWPDEELQAVMRVIGGLTKREQFAMAAMQTLLHYQKWESIPCRGEVAEESVKYADALIAELAKPKKE